MTSGIYYLYQGSTLIDAYAFNDNIGYGWTSYATLAAGTYTLKF
jgi:hypothetical protein